MRNLKKALALVLALMMTLSLMVTVSASDFTDDSAIEQDEAVSVMNSLGIINGMGDGTFDPAGSLTRAQAAKIITYMLLGQEVADSLPKTDSKFTDCPDGQWYVGSVNYLTDLGIVAGMGDGTFDPDGKVNGYQFSKMLLGALGYDSKTEGFEGDSSWTIKVATAARRAGLDEDLAASTISSVPLTREQAAKLAFNTLTATMVYYEGGVVVGDVTVNPTRKDVPNSDNRHYDKTATGEDKDKVMQFCEQYFPGLTYNAYTEADDFGHTPNGRWLNGEADAYVKLADPDVMLTEGVDADGLTKLLPKNAVIKDLSVTPIVNGAAGLGAVTSIPALADLTADGRQVEIYVEQNTETKAYEVTKVIVTVYTVETVDSVTEKDGTTTYKFSASGTKANKEDDIKVVVAGDVAKGDVVTTTKNTNGSKLYVYPTTKITGSQTAKKGTTVTIGGAQYDIADSTKMTGATAASSYGNSKDEANYWVDMNGYLVKREGIATEQDINYAIIITAVFGSSSTPTLDNPNPGQNVNVRALLDDGSVLDATLKLGKAEGTNYVTCGDVDFNGTAVNAENIVTALGDGNKLFGYYIDDGKMVLKNVTAASTGMNKDDVRYLNLSDSVKYKGTTSLESGEVGSKITTLFNSKTVFVIYDVTDGKVTAETHTGTSGLAINKDTGVADGTIVMTAPANGNQGAANVVFLRTRTVAPVVDYVYIDKATQSEVLHNDNAVYSYTGIAPDGTSDTYYTQKGGNALTQSGVYEYNADKEIKMDSETKNAVSLVNAVTAVKNSETAAETYERIVKAEVNDELIRVGSKWAKMTDDTQVVLAEGVEAVAGSNCFVVMKNADEVAVIFAYKTPAAVTATVDKESVSVTKAEGDNHTAIITVTCTEGTPAVTSGNAAVATATGTTSITVTGVEVGTTTLTITVTPTDTENYNPVTITVDVTVTAGSAE